MTTSIRTDNIAEQSHGRLRILPSADPALAGTISNDRPVWLISRQSIPRSAKSFDAVAEDAAACVTALREVFGLDVTSAFPDKSIFKSALKRSTDTINSIEGRTGEQFANTFALIDLRPEGTPVVFLLSSGSAVKLDEERRQPFMVRLAALTPEIRPSLIFTKTDSRLTREDWGQGPFRIALRHLREDGLVVVGGDASGRWLDGEFGEFQAFMDGSKNRREAEQYAYRTRVGMLQRTGRSQQMTAQGARYHIGGGIPPGLIRLSLRSKEPGVRSKRLFLDDPVLYPAQPDVHNVLPSLTDDAGALVNQVENVRWVLSVLGRPEYGGHDITNGLVRRRYSTQAMRDRHGPNASLADVPATDLRPVNRNHPIVKNLSLYKTGVWVRNINDTDVVITGVFPLDGLGWATDEDFARIDAWLAGSAGEPQKRVYTTFAHLPVLTNGHPAKLRPAVTRFTKPGEARYLLPRDSDLRHASHTDKEANRHYGYIPMLMHEWIAESIIDAIIVAGATPLPVLPPHVGDKQLMDVEKRLQRTVEARAETELRRANKEASAEDRSGDKFVAPASVRSRLWNEVEALTRTIEDIDGRVLALEDAADRHRRRVRLEQRGVRVASLVDVLVSLLDPNDTTYSTLWRTAIRRFVITHHPVRRHAHNGVELSWRFDLRVSDGDTVVDIPVRGTRLLGVLDRTEERIQAIVDDLRLGHPLTKNHRSRLLLPGVRTVLGIPASNTGRQLHCDVPALLRLHLGIIEAMGASSPKERTKNLTALAAEREFIDTFTQPDRLIDHLVGTYHWGESADNKWRRSVGTLELAAVEAAATASGRPDEYMHDNRRRWLWLRDALERTGRARQWDLRRPEGLRLNPCPGCSGYRYGIPRVHDVNGYVCLSCRTDTREVTWPESMNSLLVISPRLLTGEVTKDEPPSQGPAAKKAFARRSDVEYRPREALNDNEVAELLAYYQEGHSLRETGHRYGISFDSARVIVSEAGGTRPRGRRKRA